MRSPFGAILAAVRAKGSGVPPQFTYRVTVTAGQATTPKFTFAAGAPAAVVDWGDGGAQGAVTSGTALSHTYADAGTYTVRLIMGDQPKWITQIDIHSCRVSGGLTAIQSFPKLTNVRVDSNGAWVQDISGWRLPASLTEFDISSTGTFGSISGWTLPPDLQYFYIPSTNLGGNISNLVLTSKLIVFNLSYSYVYGSMSSWVVPATLTTLDVHHNKNNFYTGPYLYGFPSLSAAVVLSTVDVSNNALVRSDIDAILLALVNRMGSLTYHWPSIAMTAQAQTPSAAGINNKTTLTNAGWTVTSGGQSTDLASNAVNYISIPTYEGSGQVVHPDVYDAGSGNTLFGHRYWMLFEPNVEPVAPPWENPSLVYSDDKLNWGILPGASNPIDLPDANTNFSDGSLIVDGGLMWAIYNADGAASSKIYAKTTTDGITWSARKTLLTGSLGSFYSPSVIWDGAQWVMFSTNYSGGVPANITIEKRTASAIDGVWSAPATCVITGIPGAEYPWHLDVIKDVDTLYMALNTSGTFLHLCTSADNGDNWACQAGYLLRSATGRWDHNIYRSSIVKTDTGFDLWYGANNNQSPKAWRIGYTTVVYP